MKITYEIRTIKKVINNEEIEVTPANERIKALRQGNIYSVIFLEEKTITFPAGEKNGKEVIAIGWFCKVQVNVNLELDNSNVSNIAVINSALKPQEIYQGSYFKQFDDTVYGSLETALQTAQTRALGKALAHGGIGVDDAMAMADEMIGAKVKPDATVSTQETLGDISDKIQAVVENQKLENQQEVEKKKELSLADIDVKNSGELWEYIFEKGYIKRLDIGPLFKPKKTTAMGLRIVEAFEAGDEFVMKLVEGENWLERFPDSAMVKHYNEIKGGVKEEVIPDFKEIKQEIAEKTEVAKQFENLGSKATDGSITMFEDSVIDRDPNNMPCFLFTISKENSHLLDKNDRILTPLPSGEEMWAVITRMVFDNGKDQSLVYATPEDKKFNPESVIYPQGMTLGVEKAEVKETVKEDVKKDEKSIKYIETTADGYVGGLREAGKEGKPCICLPVKNTTNLKGSNIMFPSLMGFIQCDVADISIYDDNQTLFCVPIDPEVDVKSLAPTLKKGLNITITGKTTVKEEKPAPEPKKEAPKQIKKDKEHAFKTMKEMRNCAPKSSDEEISEIIKSKYNKYLDFTDFAYKANDGEVALISLTLRQTN